MELIVPFQLDSDICQLWPAETASEGAPLLPREGESH